MTRALGSGLTVDITAPTAEATELLFFDFADLSNVATPVYLTTAGRDLLWNAQTWQAVGGRLDLEALGESAEGGSESVRVTLSGVDQTLLALILGARCRGRAATIYFAHLDASVGGGGVVADPVVMFSGLMNGGFDVSESRGDFGGGAVDISCQLTSKMSDLVRIRGVRTNVHSHQATIPGASADTFFQNVPQLPLRKVYWGTKTPHTGQATPPAPPGTPGGPLGNNTPSTWRPGQPPSPTPGGLGGNPLPPPSGSPGTPSPMPHGLG